MSRVWGTPRVGAAASVIVRARDKADTIERTLRALRAQTAEPEIIVVDSGSRDASVRIARRFCDVLVETPPEQFSYGGALNRGARLASAPVHFALSAHCAPRDPDWIERSLAHYRNPRVAATAGGRRLPDGTPLRAPFLQDAAHARRHPFWGYSNHAASWRADVWREFQFDERLPAAEDREWSWRVLEAGWRIVVDPVLDIERRRGLSEGLLAWFRRRRREMVAHTMFEEHVSYDLRDLAREWWAGEPLDRRILLRRRLSPGRTVGLAGKYVGARTRRC
jgi:rhamnosyltransferase